MTWRRIGVAAIAALAIFLIAFAAVFQDSIFRFFATPRAPFQTVAAPPAPDYADSGAWLFRAKPSGAAPGAAPDNASGEAPADLFYIHSTSFYSRKAWNAPIDDEASNAILETIAAPNEAGPFSASAAVYAPRYRQATLYSLFTHKYDGLAARARAYDDVRAAFEQFLNDRDPERPLIIAGYGQGGLYAMGLLHDYFQGEINPLRRRLVAAYVISHPVPTEFLASLDPAFPLCTSPDETRCLVAYNDLEKRFDEVMDRFRERALLWTRDGVRSIATEGILCVNPLSWKADDAPVAADANLGAASATGLKPGDRPPPIPKAVGARCERGILVVDRPKPRYLRRGDWFGAKWKPQPFNLFYYDLAKNVADRTAALTRRLEVEPEPLEPIGETREVIDSPINKVPN